MAVITLNGQAPRRAWARAARARRARQARSRRALRSRRGAGAGERGRARVRGSAAQAQGRQPDRQPARSAAASTRRLIRDVQYDPVSRQHPPPRLPAHLAHRDDRGEASTLQLHRPGGGRQGRRRHPRGTSLRDVEVRCSADRDPGCDRRGRVRAQHRRLDPRARSLGRRTYAILSRSDATLATVVPPTVIEEKPAEEVGGAQSATCRARGHHEGQEGRGRRGRGRETGQGRRGRSSGRAARSWAWAIRATATRHARHNVRRGGCSMRSRRAGAQGRRLDTGRLPGAAWERRRPRDRRLMRPLTFMNLTGTAPARWMRSGHALSHGDLLVISDDVYLPVGAMSAPGARLERGPSRPREHRGRAGTSRLRALAHRRGRRGRAPRS